MENEFGWLSQTQSSLKILNEYTDAHPLRAVALCSHIAFVAGPRITATATVASQRGRDGKIFGQLFSC